ncbi:extensin family protein [Consotaella sp. CSK11QG-6]
MPEASDEASEGDNKAAEPKAAEGEPETDDESSEAAKPSVPPIPDEPLVKTYPDEPVFDPAQATEAAAMVVAAQRCEAELEKRGVKFHVADTISDGQCGVLRPIAIDRLSTGAKVEPSTVLLCQTALALDRWVADSVMPAARQTFDGGTPTLVRTASTYVCRQRVGGSKISEHSRGSGVDISGFVVGDHDVPVKTQEPGSPEEAFQRSVRNAACGPFKTVLGPGSNSDHATHFHLDLAARRQGATYCR